MGTPRAAGLRRRLAAWPGFPLAASLPLAVAAPLLGPWRPWSIGAWGVVAAFAATRLLRSRRAARRLEPNDAALLLLAAAAVNLFAASAVGGPLLWMPLYGAVVVAAAVRLPRWWSPAAAWGAAAALETSAAALAAPAGAVSPGELAIGLGALAAVAAAASAVLARDRRERRALWSELEELRHLREGVEEYGAAAERRRMPTAENVSRQALEQREKGVSGRLDRDLQRHLDLGRLAVGARGLFLFLRAADVKSLPLRCAAGPGEGPAAAGDAVVHPGEGVLGHAAQTGLPALFSLVDPGSVGVSFWEDGTAPVSLLVAPVFEEEVFRGLLAAEAAVPGAFGPEQEGLLARLAGGVRDLLAAYRADLHRERSGHRFETLIAVSAKLSRTSDPSEIFREMLEGTRRIIPCDCCAYYVAEPDGKRLLLGAELGFDVPEGKKVSLPYGRGPAGSIAQRKGPVLFTNLRARSRIVEIVPGFDGQESIAAIVGVPLLDRDRLVGVWVLGSRTAGAFTAADLDVLQFIAAEAAVLVANAELHAEVERRAITDGLTGLYNHKHFQEQLEQELERARRGSAAVSLVLMDIDHFKRVNDEHGHPFGDEVLRTLARELGRLARRVDLVARYGGEEFALILGGTNRRGCARTAERILRAVRKIRIPRAEGEEFSFTASLGTATWPDDAQSREELVAAADRALYAAKHRGRDRAVAHRDLAPLPAPVGDGRPS